MTTRTLASPVLTVGSLFSGIGGIDIAFQQAGFEISYQVEIDEYCQKVLTQHWPTVPKRRDIFTVDADTLPSTDVIAGGFPCQPFSVAGNQRGEADERFLWPEILRLVRAKRPRVVFLENVPGLRTIDSGRTFKRILRELAEIGYDAQWHHLRASDVGAPHRRERLFIVAYGKGNNGKCNSANKFCKIQTRSMGNQTMGNTPRERVEGQRSNGQQESGGYECQNVSIRSGQTMGNTSDMGCQKIQTTKSRAISYRENKRRMPESKRGCSRQVESRLGRDFARLPYRLDRHQFPAPPGPQYDWEPARTTTQAENRTARIKALGNAVVPQVIYPIAQAIREYLEIG